MADLAVWKFPFGVTDEFTIEMPASARLLHVDVQGGQPCMWALVDPHPRADKIHRRFRIYGTGHHISTPPPPAELKHVGSFLLHDGRLVFHLFELCALPTGAKEEG